MEAKRCVRPVLTTAFLLAAGAIGALSATQPAVVRSISPAMGAPVLEARELRIVDGRGIVRARIAADDRFVTLTLNDAQGTSKILLQESDAGAFALFWEQGGAGGYEVGFPVPSVNLVDRNGKVRASLPSASLMGLPPLPDLQGSIGVSGQEERGPSSVTEGDVHALRSAIDRLNSRVNEIVARLSAEGGR